MGDARLHRKLDVWQKAMDLVLRVYQMTRGFPKTEEFGLTSQMRRAAVSVPSNVAEGAARKGNKEFLQFLNIAQGSLSELDTQVELAHRLKYIDAPLCDALTNQLTEISRMLYGLAKTLR